MDPEIARRMKEVETAVLELDESVRGAAFGMMEGYVLDGTRPSRTHVSEGQPEDPTAISDVDDLEEFFSERELKKPSDAAIGIAAYLYQRYGSEAFSLEEIKEIAATVGLTVPERVDMTFKGARRNGKPMFRAVSKGKFAPTVLGETTLKKEFNIAKGRSKRPVSAPEGD